MKKWLSVLLLAMLVFSLAACGTQKDNQASDTKKDSTNTKEVFKIGAIPDQNAAELDKGMTAVAKYLSEKTGMKVEFVPSVDYAALATRRNSYGLVWWFN